MGKIIKEIESVIKQMFLSLNDGTLYLKSWIFSYVSYIPEKEFQSAFSPRGTKHEQEHGLFCTTYTEQRMDPIASF